ncbi:MAG TPA: IPT/TIG domain-containing protein [Jatrophihabitans sp.]|jgi:cell wall-associated NlpC family hydrolase|uniref:IPT/TIG domain-containing protein n=1 Tax=Jatrophihabitans sp. TaxID=1932789 RepID=UPI002E0ABE16|nr:IPT/TIG domain-containing protein [Jatrophihabitans sp.]
MTHVRALLCALLTLTLLAAGAATPADAAARPVVTGLSAHHGVYWGGDRLTVRGRNLSDVRAVRFGRTDAGPVHLVSDSTLTVWVPFHEYATVHVQVVTGVGTSTGTNADKFVFSRPAMTTPIYGGLSARQEQSISARVRASHHRVATARAGRGWTAAMGATALRRAESWLGLPYSWAGGNGTAPTAGVCAHNGGDLDCHVIGFDCSGLTLNAWAPYRSMAHYAGTQYRRAGGFHPSIGQLMPGDLVFFSAYIANGIGHVAVYAGHGTVVQAEQSGTRIMRSALADVIASSGSFRGATRPTSTGRQAAGPLVTSTTSLRTTGGYVTITGSRLDQATTVTIGGTTIYDFAQRTASRLVVRLPAHGSGAASIAVSNPWGTARSTVTYIGAPLLSGLAPWSGPAQGGDRVVVTGRDLAGVTAVLVDGRSATFESLGATGLAVTMPAHDAGTAVLTATSASGRSNPMHYLYR